MGILLFLFLGLGEISFVHAQQCIELFSQRENEQSFLEKNPKITEEIRQLFPEWNLENLSTLEIYKELLRKDQELQNSSVPLPPHLEQKLQKLYSQHYIVPTTSQELRFFYSNILNSLYSRWIWQWKKETLEELSEQKLNGSNLQMLQAIFDSHYSMRGFTEVDQNLSTLQDFFAQENWISYPWKEAYQVIHSWNQSPESKLGFTHFYPWLATQTHLPSLTRAQSESIYLSIVKQNQPVSCCKSSSACKACPHNRFWLKPKTSL